MRYFMLIKPFFSVWESEEWLKQYAKPLTGAGGKGNPWIKIDSLTCLLGLRGQRNPSDAKEQDDAEETNEAVQNDQ